ncbi:MAG: radical SAM protein, partial [Candidatus Tectomicrobia bacterium]|nr:radical SAM protein [Candidatus Tectomicrobia bacterium]
MDPGGTGKTRSRYAPGDILDFSFNKYQQEVLRLKRPLLIVWEVTHACDMSCRHCGVDAGRPLEDELTTAEALRVIDELGSMGLQHLLFAGGEPLVRPDLLQLAAHGARYFSVGINTNGYRLDGPLAERLREAGVNQVRISLDGADAPTHDYLRREGSFARAVAAVKHCLAQEFPEVGIQATLSQWNYAQLPALIELAAGLGVRVFEAREFFPTGRGKEMAHLALSHAQREEMFAYLAEM